MKEFTGTTILEAKEFLKANWKEGVSCPCCKQLVKLYRRNLNSGMAWTLIQVYLETKRSIADRVIPALMWIHVKDFLRANAMHNGHDWTLLQHWGLLEERKTDSGLPNSGRWRITDNGNRFVEMKLTVPKYLNFYNSKVWGGSDKMINIKQALGTKFNYQDLINTNL